ncbi:MAG: DUF3488 and transglutaminase-like domain-containing protein [Woeseiaceae bacterium]|nr:DUF3488 and transglutaminase-like domain-containing protein [Woeseiaceae bacterium]
MLKPRGTDGSLLSSLPWTLAALTLTLTPHVPYLPIWVTAAFFACGGIRYVIERRRAALPPALLRAALALGCFLGVLLEYGTISGVGPGSALLAVMASLKLLETRKRRDQFVLLFIAVFLVMAALLREQYLWSLPYLVVALFIIMTAWLRMSAASSEAAARSFRTAGRLIGYAAPLAIAMWVLFPRISAPFWSVPIDTSSGVTGLSDTMSPGDISALSQSDAVAFRARFFGDVPAPRERYWRAMVLTNFNGRSWTGGEPAIGRRPDDQIEFRGNPVRYQITIEPTRQHWVPALEAPAHWNLDRTYMGRMQELVRSHPIDQRVAYEVTSYTRYAADPAMPSVFRNWYMDLPEGPNPRAAELAAQLSAAASSREAYIEAVLSMFNTEDFYYTLQPPALGANSVDEFLFRTRRGFCEHYASSFAVLMRAAGLPARVVLGYQGGEVHPMGDYVIVRQSDAHAWNEVWLDDRGWVRIDPTAAVAPERIEVGFTNALFDGIGEQWGVRMPSQLMHQLQLTWDLLNASWNDLVLGYGPDKQQSLLEWLGMERPTWRKMLLTLIGIVVLLTIAVSLLLKLRYRPPPKDAAVRLYDRFVKKTGITPRTGETPLEFASRAAGQTTLGSPAIDNVTSAYLAARYSGGGDAALATLRRSVAALGARQRTLQRSP